MTTGATEADARWLATLQRLVGRAAHELKGALNGVSINLEVIRSRVERSNATASTVGSFAVSATSQLDEVISLSEALLGLTRAAAEPVEVGVEARRIAILLGAAARSNGGQLTVDDARALAAVGRTSASGSAVRAALGECMLAAVDLSKNVGCAAVADSPATTVRIDARDDGALDLNPELVAMARGAGIDIRAEHSTVLIVFPG